MEKTQFELQTTEQGELDGESNHTDNMGMEKGETTCEMKKNSLTEQAENGKLQSDTDTCQITSDEEKINMQVNWHPDMEVNDQDRHKLYPKQEIFNYTWDQETPEIYGNRADQNVYMDQNGEIQYQPDNTKHPDMEVFNTRTGTRQIPEKEIFNGEPEKHQMQGIYPFSEQKTTHSNPKEEVINHLGKRRNTQVTEEIITTEGNEYQNDDGKQYKTYHGGGNNGNTYTRRKPMGADIENGVEFHTNGDWGR